MLQQSCGVSQGHTGALLQSQGIPSFHAASRVAHCPRSPIVHAGWRTEQVSERHMGICIHPKSKTSRTCRGAHWFSAGHFYSPSHVHCFIMHALIVIVQFPETDALLLVPSQQCFDQHKLLVFVSDVALSSCAAEPIVAVLIGSRREGVQG